MYKYEIYKGDFEDVTKSTIIKTLDDPLIIVDYLTTLPASEMWIYEIVTWFIGEDGDWPEDEWDHEDTTRADEWLETQYEVV